MGNNTREKIKKAKKPLITGKVCGLQEKIEQNNFNYCVDTFIEKRLYTAKIEKQFYDYCIENNRYLGGVCVYHLLIEFIFTLCDVVQGYDDMQIKRIIKNKCQSCYLSIEPLLNQMCDKLNEKALTDKQCKKNKKVINKHA